MITIFTTVMWLILFYAVIKRATKNYNGLLTQNLELSEHLRKLKNVKNENAELKAEIRNLKTKLKEQAVNELQTSNFKGGEMALHDWQMKKDVDWWNSKVKCECCGKEIELKDATIVSSYKNGELEYVAYFCDIDCVGRAYEGG